WTAYPLLLLPIAFVALFPALACGFAGRLVRRYGVTAALIMPVVWVACDWLRYVLTGQVWNAIGYSQAFHPAVIQLGSWGGVYAVSVLIVLANTLVALPIIRRTASAVWASVAGITLLVLIAEAATLLTIDSRHVSSEPPSTFVIAVQPNVPMDSADPAAMDALLKRHEELSKQGLLFSQNIPGDRLVIWPESPMNFSYSRDPQLQKTLANLARTNNTSILLNSLEPAKDGSDQNSAILVNEKGEMSARYDKIRLMPFGEYV